MIPLWVATSVFYTIALALPRPRSPVLSAVPDSRPLIKALLIRTAMAASFYVFVPGGQLKLLSLLWLGFALGLAEDAIRHGTHFTPWVRATRAAGSGAVAYAALALVFRVHHEDRHVSEDSAALIAGAPLAALAAAAVSLWRARASRALANRLLQTAVVALQADPGYSPGALDLGYRFRSTEEVHCVAADLARRAVGKATCPPEILFSVEAIFLAGIRQFPESALLQVLLALFKLDLAVVPSTGAEESSGAPPPAVANIAGAHVRSAYLSTFARLRLAIRPATVLIADPF